MTAPPDPYDDLVDNATVTSRTVSVTISRPTILQQIFLVLIVLAGFAFTLFVVIPVGLFIVLVVLAMTLIGRARRAVARLFAPNGPRQGRRNVRVISRDGP